MMKTDYKKIKLRRIVSGGCEGSNYILSIITEAANRGCPMVNFLNPYFNALFMNTLVDWLIENFPSEIEESN